MAQGPQGTGPKTARRRWPAAYHGRMPSTTAATNALHDDAAYQALTARDARFDGRLFVGVTSTGIYCRPVCRVRLPRRENCRFFANAALAEHHGFRPCLRCRPELAPGLSLTDSSDVLADQAARFLTQAAHAGEAPSLPAIAARLGVTDRHMRRIFARRHGVTPLAYLGTQRLLLAKQLLTDTTMPVTEVALASGFGSLRRFQAAFAQHYRLTPGALRRQGSAATATAEQLARGAGPSTAAQAATTCAAAKPSAAAMPSAAAKPSEAAKPIATARPSAAADTRADTLRLAYRPPYDQAGVLAFMARRAVAGLEQADAGGLRRTLALQHQGATLAGWLDIRFQPERNAVLLQVSPTLRPALGPLLQRVRQALDLDAEPGQIDPVMATVPGPARPGLRLPGAWCGFESAVRVVLGQQVTVAAARTLTHRLVQRFGAPVATPWPGLDRLFPSAATLATASAEDIGTLGIVRQRVRALQALAAAVASGELTLEPGASTLADPIQALTALPGIGDWSAQLIAMRALAWPDAWPATDIGLLQALAAHTAGQRDAAAATALSEVWRPWRSYAVMHLWHALEPAGLADASTPARPWPDPTAPAPAPSDQP